MHMTDSTADISFSVNFDYRCPFARNANEHVVTALSAGAPWSVEFAPFSLSQVHVAEGEPDVWDAPDKRDELTAVAAGVVVRDRFPTLFPGAHVALFAARHDHAGDLRDAAVIRDALRAADVDPDAVFAELDAGWPYDVVRDTHERWVSEHHAFGVPTFVLGDRAVFVRFMSRPAGDSKLAERTISRVLDLLVDAPELNEFKHTSIPR
ncbi:MAG: DsbA family protein [Actinomycetota bacterium]|nr:DsbA family protein [Actinomycetota bacterium]